MRNNITAGVSVIVCCYNSAKRLPETLKHLALQQVPAHIPWEIIIVNNASTDDTVDVAKKEWEQYQLSVPFRVADQPMSGLSYARDKGFETAQYEYCLFCDDDNWLDKDYIGIIFETMERDPMIGVLGGQGEAVCEVSPPEWFEEHKKSYAIGAQANSNNEDIEIVYTVYGAGAVFRNSIYKLLKQNGFVSLLTDRKGNSLSSGGDIELCFNFKLLGYKICYFSKIKFFHFIEKSRLTKDYLQRLNQENSKARIVLSLYNYTLTQSANLNKRFLLLREIFYALTYIYKEDLKSMYAFILLKNYKTYCKTLNHLRKYNNNLRKA